MHAQTIKCIFNRVGMPKLLGLVKKDYLFYFNLFLNSSIQKNIFRNTQEFCVLGLLWQLPYLHLAVCFCFLPGLLSDSF